MINAEPQLIKIQSNNLDPIIITNPKLMDCNCLLSAGLDNLVSQARVNLLVCCNCKTLVGVGLESSRTMYRWDGGLDRNRDIPLCSVCAVEHHIDWNDRWAEYYSGLL